jgi:hypothetical protein
MGDVLRQPRFSDWSAGQTFSIKSDSTGYTCVACQYKQTYRAESCNNGTTRRHDTFWGDTGLITTWLLPCNHWRMISMRNSGGSLASQMHSWLLQPSNHAPNETQQTRIKLGLPLMQEESPKIPSRWRCQSIPWLWNQEIQPNKRDVH